MKRACRVALIVSVTSLGLGCDGLGVPLDPKTGVPMLYPEGEGSGPVSARSAALLSTGDCDELRAGLRARLVQEVVAEAQAAFASAWKQREQCGGWNQWNKGTPLPSAAADGGMAAPPPSSPTEPAHSETNNQVAGVDEPDIVKTDGNYIYLVGKTGFRILRSWPAAQTGPLAQVAIAGTPKKLFIYKDRVLVFSALGADPTASGYGSSSSECTYGYDCVPTGDGRPTKITILDIANRAAPKLLREVTISSSLLSARRVGSAVHTVVTTGTQNQGHLPSWPSGIGSVCDHTERELYAAFRALLLANLETIAIKTGLPGIEDVVHTAAGPKRHEDSLADCRTYLRSSLGDGEQLTSVVSLAMDSDAPTRSVTVVSRPGVVYASEQSLYLAEPRQRTEWGWYEAMTEDEATTVHKFSLSNAAPAEARYVASGLVKGRLLNQFSLDEHRGVLRIASTSGQLWGSNPSRNILSVLRQKEAALEPVGLLDGIAPGEDIRAVRFDGDRGYVVTFKKTDPLFVLDLADAERPRVLGEAKIPGFSTYMQRLDDRHLITIGYDGDDQGSFAWFAGVALQIFDVSDPLQPKLAFKHVIGTRGSSSEALTNHLAFTYYAPKNLLAVPMTICEGGSGGGFGTEMTFSGLMLFDVSTVKGLSERGRVAFPAGEGATCSNWWTQASSQVKRSLIIESFVYSMSETLLKVNDLDKLSPDLVSLPLD